MLAKVMKVVNVEKHPNADALYVYDMVDNYDITVKIVANSTIIYNINDNAIVALDGAILNDGTEIKKTYIRGILSNGMALGKTSKSVGTDLTKEYCASLDNSVFHTAWPSIESFYNVYKYVTKNNLQKSMFYAGKVKLDGTNGGIIILPNGTVAAQSRSRLVTSKDDNMGFAAWVESNKEYFSSLARNEKIILFGEFVGKGIQKSTAISKLDKKVFVIFAIRIGNYYEISPSEIASIVKPHEDIFILPFETRVVEFDFKDREKLNSTVEWLNDYVLRVEKEDPWVKNVFDISGIGEGLVMYPLSGYESDLNNSIKINSSFFSDFVFKAKGEKHKVVKTKSSVQIDPEVAKNINEFVTMFVTENRLKQWAHDFDKKNLGYFLKEFCKDVQKESKDELEASNLKWKQVVKEVSRAAKNWYIGKCNEI